MSVRLRTNLHICFPLFYKLKEWCYNNSTSTSMYITSIHFSMYCTWQQNTLHTCDGLPRNSLRSPPYDQSTTITMHDSQCGDDVILHTIYVHCQKILLRFRIIAIATVGTLQWIPHLNAYHNPWIVVTVILQGWLII